MLQGQRAQFQDRPPQCHPEALPGCPLSRVPAQPLLLRAPDPAELARILYHTSALHLVGALSAGPSPGQHGSGLRHDSFGSLPSSGLSHLRQKSGLLSPPGLPKPGLSPGSAPYSAAYYVSLTSYEPVSHLQSRHTKPTTFTDSTNLFLCDKNKDE